MMMSDKLLDATGLACPMPIVKTKKAIDELLTGQVLEVHATDKGAQRLDFCCNILFFYSFLNPYPYTYK